MERKKRSKCSGWECCYAEKKIGTFGVEMRACGQKLVKFCTHTDTHTHAAKLVVRIGPGCSNKVRGTQTSDTIRAICEMAILVKQLNITACRLLLDSVIF